VSKKQEYYKVVSVENGKLFSYAKDSLPANLQMQYYVHRPVTATVGGLLVFNSLDFAIHTWRSYGDRRIYRCTVRDEIQLPTYRVEFDWDLKFYEFEDCWGNDLSKIRVRAPWPVGTCAFKTVTLRERIK